MKPYLSGHDLSSGPGSDGSAYAIMAVGRKNGRKNGKTQFVVLATGKTIQEAEKNLEKANRERGGHDAGLFIKRQNKKHGPAFEVDVTQDEIKG